MEFNSSAVIGIAGAGAMGIGIAQVAAHAGHQVLLFDTRTNALHESLKNLEENLIKLSGKGKLTVEDVKQITGNIKPVSSIQSFESCALVIEAITEQLSAKQNLFAEIENVVNTSCVLATNTSSLSVTAIAGKAKIPERFAGLHFFNPAPLMPLVEVIPAMQTSNEIISACMNLMRQWKKIPVLAKDTPGFIVNRIARPFYGEALRICEEQLATQEAIDQSMKVVGGFKMGPFELMDLIGNDINYAVTETVWSQTYFDPRYKPSIIQKRMVEAGRLGRKSGKGYYDYPVQQKNTSVEPEQAELIHNRILVMLMNEAADALHFGIASATDIDLAMTKGVNYPKGLLHWADEYGIARIVDELDQLQHQYREDRYRASVRLRRMAADQTKFFS